MALPPGLAFGVAQKNILERAASKADRGIYFDFLEFERHIQNNQTPNTPAVSLLYALAAQMERMAEETIERRWLRHAEMAQRTYAWVDDMNERGINLQIMAPAGSRSPTVTCLRTPDPWTGPSVVAAARERGFALATGYGKLKDGTFRIGHMGEHTMEELEALLEALTDVFA